MFINQLTSTVLEPLNSLLAVDALPDLQHQLDFEKKHKDASQSFTALLHNNTHHLLTTPPSTEENRAIPLFGQVMLPLMQCLYPQYEPTYLLKQPAENMLTMLVSSIAHLDNATQFYPQLEQFIKDEITQLMGTEDKNTTTTTSSSTSSSHTLSAILNSLPILISEISKTNNAAANSLFSSLTDQLISLQTHPEQLVRKCLNYASADCSLFISPEVFASFTSRLSPARARMLDIFVERAKEKQNNKKIDAVSSVPAAETISE